VAEQLLTLPGNSSVGTLTVTGEVPLTLSDTSGSGTSQTATSSPTFTPAANVCWTYTTTTANTGAALTVSINGLSKSVAVSWNFRMDNDACSWPDSSQQACEDVL